MSRGERLASAVIVVVVGLQFLASFQITPGPIEGSPFLWPFLDYPMYTTPRDLGDTLPRFELHGVLADSSEVEIGPSDLQMGFWVFRRGVLFDISDTARAEEIARKYEELHGREIRGFRLYERPFVLTGSGVDSTSHDLILRREVSTPRE